MLTRSHIYIRVYTNIKKRCLMASDWANAYLFEALWEDLGTNGMSKLRTDYMRHNGKRARIPLEKRRQVYATLGYNCKRGSTHRRISYHHASLTIHLSEPFWPFLLLLLLLHTPQPWVSARYLLKSFGSSSKISIQMICLNWLQLATTSSISSMINSSPERLWRLVIMGFSQPHPKVFLNSIPYQAGYFTNFSWRMFHFPWIIKKAVGREITTKHWESVLSGATLFVWQSRFIFWKSLAKLFILLIPMALYVILRSKLRLVTSIDCGFCFCKVLLFRK